MKQFITATIFFLLIVFNYDTSDAIVFTDFGPYKGKVVDADTGKPVEEVVVLVEWTKITMSGSKFLDIQETLTDKNGQFVIPGIWVLNPLTRTSTMIGMTIYKSGYKAIETGAWRKWDFFNPSHNDVLKVEDGLPVFKLYKASNREERLDNLLGLPIVSSKVHHKVKHKWKLLKREVNKERKLLGLETYE